MAVGTSEPTWDAAAVDVEVDGVRAEVIDLGTMDPAPGAPATGTVVLEVTPGSVADPEVGGAAVTLHLLDGDVEVGRRRDTITAVAGPDRAWFSHGSEGEALRAMLTDLLASGEITRQQYDAGLTATTESTGQSTVEVIPPSED